MAPIIGRGFITLKLEQFKRRIEVWVVEVCDPCPIGLDMLTAGGWVINLVRGVLRMGFEWLPSGGVSTDERAELETQNPMTIPLGAEARVPAQ